MKLCLFLILFFNMALALAATTVTVEGEDYRCEKAVDLTLHCSSGDKLLLVKKSTSTPVALLKNGDNPALLKYISRITDNNKVLYIADAPVSSVLASSKHFALFSSRDPWLKNFTTSSAEKHPLDKLPYKIETKEGTVYCQKGESSEEESVEGEEKKTCPFYACTVGESRILAFVPQPGGVAEVPHLIKLKGQNSELLTEGFKIFDRTMSETDELFNMPAPLADNNSMNESAGPSSDYFIPQKYQKNKTAFEYLTDPVMAPGLKKISDYCIGKNDVTRMIREREDIGKKMTEDLMNMRLSHYLTLTDGNLIGLVVNGERAGELGCLHDGMILSPEARLHLEYLNKARVKPPSRYLSEREVQDLFKEASAMADIPFGYKKDGCYARAHVMAKRFKEKGIEVEKAWIKGYLKVPGTNIEWNYHVAPAINVLTDKGEIKKFIIDPSLNDKAVPVEKWIESMGKNYKKEIMPTGYPFPENIASYNKAALAFSAPEIYSPDNDESRTAEGDMASAVQVMQEYTEALKEEQQ